MFLSHIDEIASKTISGDGVKNIEKQALIGPEQGWKGQVMRRFVLTDGGHTPKHSHPWPHTVLVLEGEGELFYEGETFPLKAGSVAQVTENREHQFRQSSKEPFAFICIVPEEGDA